MKLILSLISLTNISSGYVLQRGRSFFITRNFAAQYDGGAASSTVISRCEAKLIEMLKPTKCVVRSSEDDPNGSHIAIEVVSEEFVGKTTMQRQRLVYKAIWDEMNNGVHAVDSIVAKTPSE